MEKASNGEHEDEDLTWVMSPEDDYLLLAHQLEHQPHAGKKSRKDDRLVVPPASSFPSSPHRSAPAPAKRTLTDISSSPAAKKVSSTYSSLSKPPPFLSRKRKSSPNEIIITDDDQPKPSSTSSSSSSSTSSSGSTSSTSASAAASPALKKQKSINHYFGFQRLTSSSSSSSSSSSTSPSAREKKTATASSTESNGKGPPKEEAWWLRAARGEADQGQATRRASRGQFAASGAPLTNGGHGGSRENGAGRAADNEHHHHHRHQQQRGGRTGDANRSSGHAKKSAPGAGTTTTNTTSSHYVDRWDKQHVRMPCSPKNVYAPTTNWGGHQVLESKWELIQTVLQQSIVDSYAIEEAILTFNQSYKNKWSFGGLHAFFAEHCSPEERRLFFGSTLPFMIDLVLSTREICPEPIEFLEKQHDKVIMLSQKQIACLLANAFFCTFPGRNTKMGEKAVGQKYPSINFSDLFMSPMTGQRLGKLQCILNYFHRISSQPLVGNVSFHRRVLHDFPDWQASKAPLRRLTVRSDGTIEDDTGRRLGAPDDISSSPTEVDFANKLIGGGVLGRGCVQEEIRFLISPELIVARLFCAEFDDNECLVMMGSERFSDYTGYSDSFCFGGDHQDASSRDSWGRMRTTIVAIDALEFSRWGASDEFRQRNVERELNKAYCGFLAVDDGSPAASALPLVSTGHWGCGAFGGTKELKSLIQLMAASLSRRDMLYFTFGDEVFAQRLKDTHALLLQQNATVGDVYEAITEYAELMEDSQGNMDLFDFLAARFG